SPPSALDPLHQIGDADVQSLSEMGQSGERGSDPAGLHLPDILPLEIDHALGRRSELGHRQAPLLAKRADALSHLLQKARLSGNVWIHARRHTNSTIAPSASSP